MALEQEIEKAVSYFDKDKLAILHCESDYPLEYSNANLKSIVGLKKQFKCVIGFADHSITT